MFGNYTEVATVNTNSAKVNAVDSKNKYNNYYKVVALNNGNFGDLDLVMLKKQMNLNMFL